MTKLENFVDNRKVAEQRAGGPAELKKLLPTSKSAKALKTVADDRYLSLMSLRVFSSGLKHSMVAGKWPDFEEIFFAFEPKRVAAIPDEELEALLKETRIIRHWRKIKATRHNAAAMAEISTEHGGFGAWLAAWPEDDIVGLWNDLQKRFSQLGGASRPYFLRMAAIEIVDDRFVDYSKLKLPTMLADDFFNAGCVLGTPLSAWQTLDIGALRGEMMINGKAVGSGFGRDVMGHPFNVLAWLANSLIERGRELQAGEFVLTGSLMETQWCQAGDVVRVEIDSLGAAEMQFSTG